MRFQTLPDWLKWQESLNPKEIDLGLDRVTDVLAKLNFTSNFFCPVITVAGTNGKGSTVAFIESILKQSDISVGCYTSPHLFNYNERIRINQQSVSDEDLCDAFHMIDNARGDVALTYFEFGTLASLVIFKKYNVDVAVLEVGLGGRLDAVNVIDADVSVITSIDIDHVDWLGDDVEVIAREKAGIMRKDQASVVSIFKPPRSLLEHAKETGVQLHQLGKDYLYQGISNQHWQLRGAGLHLDELPMPVLKGGFQLQNASAAIMAVSLLKLPKVQTESIAKGLQQVQLAGRFEQVSDVPQVMVDVAHNAQSAHALHDILSESPINGRTIAVVAMLADKAIDEVLNAVHSQVHHWVSAGLVVNRGLSAKKMAQAVRELDASGRLSVCETVTEACQNAEKIVGVNDRIIVFGSFYTVAEATQYFKHRHRH